MGLLGPDLDQTVLLPKIEEYRRVATEHIRTRTLPERMDHVWAWVVAYDGNEHIVGLAGHPLVDADLRLLRLARPVMEEIARQTDWAVRLVRFDRTGESIETINGRE